MSAVLYAEAERRISRKRHAIFGVLGAIVLYSVYLFFAFDVPGLAQRLRLDNAAVLLRDTYSHRVQVTRDNRRDTVAVSVDGERNGQYPAERWPDWVRAEGASTLIDLPRGVDVRYDPDAVRLAIPGYGAVEVVTAASGITVRTPGGALPDWISASDRRVDITRPEGRVTVTRARAETFRYFLGWPMFFFTTESPFHYMSWVERGPRWSRPSRSGRACPTPRRCGTTSGAIRSGGTATWPGRCSRPC